MRNCEGWIFWLLLFLKLYAIQMVSFRCVIWQHSRFEQTILVTSEKQSRSKEFLSRHVTDRAYHIQHINNCLMINHLSKLRSTIYMCLIIYWIFFDILECDYKMSMQFSSHVESPERVFHLPGVCMDLCMVAATLAPCWHHARSLDQDKCTEPEKAPM